MLEMLESSWILGEDILSFADLHLGCYVKENEVDVFIFYMNDIFKILILPIFVRVVLLALL